MAVSRQAEPAGRTTGAGPRARMKRVLLDTAMELMQRGFIPSVSDVAQTANVSRATAYRYFPSQAAMIQDAVNEALGPILGWTSEAADPEERIADLIAFAYPRIDAFEATHRGALLLALDQWTRRKAGTLGDEAAIVRGHRKALLAEAVAPLKGRLGKRAFDRLVQSLSLIFGTEAFVVLKDIWGLDGVEARQVAVWSANALVRAAVAEAAAKQGIRPVRSTRRNAAKRPRGKLN
ncbi:MAG: TetR/AcrR family transcriptional regulator [Bauldia sp.]